MGGFDTSEPIQDRSTTSTMPTMAYNAMLGQCPRGTIGAPDDDLFGQTIQPALGHTEYTPVAHFCAKETSQVCTECGAVEAKMAKYAHFFDPNPVGNCEHIRSQLKILVINVIHMYWL